VSLHHQSSFCAALVLYDVHGAPFRWEARHGIDRLEDAEAEGGGAEFGDVTDVFNAVA
jgi:hypothetical protein